jgi:DNA-binding LytR/AlgR family response regulator
VKVKILIVEDERPAAERLISLLRKTALPVEILDITESVESTVNWLATHPDPDIILMDIQLEDGISFEVFESVKVLAPVIFTTAYDTYALKAFSVNSIDYLLKPVEFSDLERALNKYQYLFKRTRPEAMDWTSLMEQVKPARKERFLVRAGQKFISVTANHVAVITSEEGGTYLKMFTGHQYDVDYTLEQLEKLLNPSVFFRISRNCILHADSIADMIPLSGSKLKVRLKSGLSSEGILVSRDRLQAFKKWMDR